MTTLFNNDYDDNAKFGKGLHPSYIETNRGRLIPANKTKARYVRLYSAGNTSNVFNHYIEIEVFGRPSG